MPIFLSDIEQRMWPSGAKIGNGAKEKKRAIEEGGGAKDRVSNREEKPGIPTTI